MNAVPPARFLPIGAASSTRRGAISRRTHGHAVRWVHDLLRHELRSSAFPDQALPSEYTLIKTYDVSRGTVRRVMEMLAEEGLIERLRGTGTFSLSPTIVRHGLDISQDFAQEVNETGTRATIFRTHVERHRATDFIAAKLDIDAEDDIVIVETTTYLDGFPFSRRTAFMPCVIFADQSPESIDFNRSPYEILGELTGQCVGVTRISISAAVADESTAAILGIPVGAPTLDTNRVIFDSRDRPIEYSLSRARSDRVSFEVTMESRTAKDTEPH
ncbi:GntR family transcriptional regulator [Cumulibacter soli]|uniref:GntR family transcriptional regulator n=1 Tax=Cumulibacter soli TaxID=2546344 RepID=UPI0010685351|nr:GntR family transcriptional regulator [Cumulibacter soli]